MPLSIETIDGVKKVKKENPTYLDKKQAEIRITELEQEVISWDSIIDAHTERKQQAKDEIKDLKNLIKQM